MTTARELPEHLRALLPPKPARPAPEECCKSDCIPCILELYEEELERWEQKVADVRARYEAGELPAERSPDTPAE